MKAKIITDARWLGDGKSVNFTTYDANKGIGIGIHTIEVGNNNWVEENEKESKKIIAQEMEKEGIIVDNDYDITLRKKSKQ